MSFYGEHILPHVINLAMRNRELLPQLGAWQDIRNAVMHGSLVSPYSARKKMPSCWLWWQ
jgi:hypothetical protein